MSANYYDYNIEHDQAIILDEGTPNSYHGSATKGSVASAPVWKIKRINVVGGVTTVTWADGDSNYDNVWNNSASLTYT